MKLLNKRHIQKLNITANSNQSQKKHPLVRCISVFIMLLGIYIFTSNVYHFAQGYFAYKTYIPSNNSKPSISNNEIIETQNKPLYATQPELGEKIGDLYIPKLDITLPIYHGTSEKELEKGVGHFAQSVLPGENDNSVLSGHRDTVFRNLDKIGKSDLLIVKTSAGEFTYKVKNVRIVGEDDRSVIVPKPKATLTLSTCYPFNYIGPAPKRFILIANLYDKKLY